jgi:UDP-glucose 4-epimerase
VRRVTGRPLVVKEEARRAGDPPRLVADASAARTRLGWKPRYPALETIVEHAWNFERTRR